MLTRFTDGRDPKPRSREVFSFHRPETLRDWFGKPSFRAGLQNLPPLNPAGLRRISQKATTRRIPTLPSLITPTSQSSLPDARYP